MKTPQIPSNTGSPHGADLPSFEDLQQPIADRAAEQYAGWPERDDRPAEFKLNIHTDDAAFDGEDRNLETARILEDVSARLRAGEPFDFFISLFSIAGNRVGSAKFVIEETE